MSKYEPPRINFDKVSNQPPPSNKPEPFQRPTIELSKVKREWLWVYPEDISKYDIIPDLGLISDVYMENEYYTHVHIEGANGTKSFNADVKIWAFTRKIEPE